MLLTRLVVEEGLLLDGLADPFGGDPAALELDGQLENVEGAARIAVREARDEGQGVGIRRDLPGAEPARDVVKGALEDAHDVGLGQRTEDIDPAAREERRVHLEGGILRGRPDQDQRALLHVRQEGVLLTAIEAMNLVHEENGPPAAAGALGFRLRHDLAYLLDARQDGREGNEARPRDLGHEEGQRGLARARRSPEDHRVQGAVLEGAAQDLTGADEVLLAHDLVQGSRPHAVGEGGGRGGRPFRRRRIEEIHVVKYTIYSALASGLRPSVRTAAGWGLRPARRPGRGGRRCGRRWRCRAGRTLRAGRDSG